MSPGWQSSALQMASSVEKRMAFALPVFRMERLAWVMPILSASSCDDILRRAIITSTFTMILIRLTGVLDGQFLLVLQVLAHQDNLRDHHQRQTCEDVHAVTLVLEHDIIIRYVHVLNKILCRDV